MRGPGGLIIRFDRAVPWWAFWRKRPKPLAEEIAELRRATVTDGPSKGGQNPDNTSNARPAAPGGSGGRESYSSASDEADCAFLELRRILGAWVPNRSDGTTFGRLVALAREVDYFGASLIAREFDANSPVIIGLVGRARAVLAEVVDAGRTNDVLPNLDAEPKLIKESYEPGDPR